MHRRRSCPQLQPAPSAFAGFRFPAEVILLAVRWYLRFGLSHRDLEERLVERGIEVDHVTVYRWVPRFTPMPINAARTSRHAVGGRWFIDVYASRKRDIAAARRFFTTALTAHDEPDEERPTWPTRSRR